MFDGGAAAEVPAWRLQQALAAEGLPCHGSYGPVYRHMLYNMSPSQYRIHGGASCPVAEGTGTRHAVCLPHPWLGADEWVIAVIGEIVAKVASHAAALRAS